MGGGLGMGVFLGGLSGGQASGHALGRLRGMLWAGFGPHEPRLYLYKTGAERTPRELRGPSLRSFRGPR
eukprot:7613682-Alexandrium_andersonii.AAC.1